MRNRKKRVLSTAGVVCGLLLAHSALAQNQAYQTSPGETVKTPVIHRQIEMPTGDLYNTMDYADQGTFSEANGDGIGGSAVYIGHQYNLGVADDIVLDNSYLITTVEAAYQNYFGAVDTDALVEIFPDAGGVPAEQPVHSACLAASMQGAGNLNHCTWIAPSVFPIHRDLPPASSPRI